MYGTLLMPFSDTKPAVQPLIDNMLASSDKRLKYRTMLMLMRNGKSYPDSMLTYFAGIDDYRYELYDDLKDMKKLDKFPAKYNNHIDLGKSKLLEQKAYDQPDSVLYIDRLPAEVKGKKGYVYFFRYKNKKDDPTWKLASVGLVPEDPKKFEFDPEPVSNNVYFSDIILSQDYSSRYRKKADFFTEFSDAKIKDEQALPEQLKKQLKKLLYSRRKSAKEFYSRDYSEGFDVAEDFPE